MTGQEMPKYLGVKVIHAEKMDELMFFEKLKGIPSVNEENRDGYKVVYPDDYVSWSPKEAFEKAYKPLPEGHNGLIIDVDPLDGSWAYVNAPSGCIGKNGVSDPYLNEKLIEKPNQEKLYCTNCGNVSTSEKFLDRCICGCGHFQPAPSNEKIQSDCESSPRVLSVPSAHPLIDCLKELCFGRPAAEQIFLIDCISKVECTSETFSFGTAIEKLKSGFKVARGGWTGMWLKYINGQNGELPRGSKYLLPWIGMKTSEDGFVPWQPSQYDMLSEDWIIVDESQQSPSSPK